MKKRKKRKSSQKERGGVLPFINLLLCQSMKEDAEEEVYSFSCWRNPLGGFSQRKLAFPPSSLPLALREEEPWRGMALCPESREDGGGGRFLFSGKGSGGGGREHFSGGVSQGIRSGVLPLFLHYHSRQEEEGKGRKEERRLISFLMCLAGGGEGGPDFSSIEEEKGVLEGKRKEHAGLPILLLRAPKRGGKSALAVPEHKGTGCALLPAFCQMKTGPTPYPLCVGGGTRRWHSSSFLGEGVRASLSFVFR